MARHALSVLVLLALLAPLQASPADAAGGTHRPWSTVPPGPYGLIPATPQEFTASDGTAISYAVYRPAVPLGVRVPVLLSAGPYFALSEEPVHVPSTTRLTGFLVENFVSHGYAVVAASVRGTGWSGGCMELMSLREARDLDELVTFLATRSWADGNVGMIGKSYDGTTPWMVARFGNPHLKTIVPIAGVTDLPDLLVRDGVPQWRTPIFHGLVYYPYGLGLDPLGGSVGGSRGAERAIQGAACPEAARGLAVGMWSAATGDTRAVQAGRDYWGERRFREDVVANYRGSVFAVHGLQDVNVVPHTIVPFFGQLPQEKKLLLGQWGHHYPDEGAFTSRADFALMLKAWFDRHLKGAQVGTGPVVEVADGGTGAWRALDAWPPATSARAARYHLSAAQTLTQEPPLPFREVVATPLGVSVYRAACAFDNAARFTATPAATSFTISGAPTLRVRLEPATVGAVVALLCVDGRVVGHGATSTLYADGGDDPKPFAPGVPLEVRIEMEPIEHTVPAGARLALAVLMDDTVGDRSGADYGQTASTGVALLTAGELRLPVS